MRASDEYRVVPGWPDTRVSRDGRLQTTLLARGRPGTVWRDVRPGLSGSGLLRWARKAGGRKGWLFVHRLVYEAWVGPIPPLCGVRHLDGDRANNTVENLELEPYTEERIEWMRRTGRLPAEGVES